MARWHRQPFVFDSCLWNGFSSWQKCCCERRSGARKPAGKRPAGEGIAHLVGFVFVSSANMLGWRDLLVQMPPLMLLRKPTRHVFVSYARTARHGAVIVTVPS